jgi:hypothetical protein
LLDTVTCHQNPMPFTLKNDVCQHRAFFSSESELSMAES